MVQVLEAVRSNQFDLSIVVSRFVFFNFLAPALPFKDGGVSIYFPSVFTPFSPSLFVILLMNPLSFFNGQLIINSNFGDGAF